MWLPAIGCENAAGGCELVEQMLVRPFALSVIAVEEAGSLQVMVMEAL
jgi:hypothetical protein